MAASGAPDGRISPAIFPAPPMPRPPLRPSSAPPPFPVPFHLCPSLFTFHHLALPSPFPLRLPPSDPSLSSFQLPSFHSFPLSPFGLLFPTSTFCPSFSPFCPFPYRFSTFCSSFPFPSSALPSPPITICSFPSPLLHRLPLPSPPSAICPPPYPLLHLPAIHECPKPRPGSSLGSLRRGFRSPSPETRPPPTRDASDAPIRPPGDKTLARPLLLLLSGRPPPTTPPSLLSSPSSFQALSLMLPRHSPYPFLLSFRTRLPISPFPFPFARGFLSPLFPFPFPLARGFPSPCNSSLPTLTSSLKHVHSRARFLADLTPNQGQQLLRRSLSLRSSLFPTGDVIPSLPSRLSTS